jgi:predicted nicotinamide N-methyase
MRHPFDDLIRKKRVRRQNWGLLAAGEAMLPGALRVGTLYAASAAWLPLHNYCRSIDIPRVYWIVPWASALMYASYRIARPNPITFTASTLVALAASQPGISLFKRQVPSSISHPLS